MRDSISQPGNYVMTCCWHAQPLHFVIDRILKTDPSGYRSAQYAFEQHAFPKVSELIHHYIALQIPVSDKSGALIKTPINRTVHPGENNTIMTGGKMTPMGTSANVGQSWASQSNRYRPHLKPYGSSADIVSGSLQNSGSGIIPHSKGIQASLGNNGCDGGVRVRRQKGSMLMSPSTSSKVMPYSGSDPVMRQSTTLPAGHLSQQGGMTPVRSSGHLVATKQLSGNKMHSISSDSVSELLKNPTDPGYVKDEQHPRKLDRSPRPMRKGRPCNVIRCKPTCDHECGITASEHRRPSFRRSSKPSFSKSTRQSFSKSSKQSFSPHCQPDIFRSTTPRPKTAPKLKPKPKLKSTYKCKTKSKLSRRKSKPHIPIRNWALYADDGEDYTDYAQVISWSGTASPPESLKPTSSAPPSRQKPKDDVEEFDNNFLLASRMVAEADYDIPTSRKLKKSRKKGETHEGKCDALTPTDDNWVKKNVYHTSDNEPTKNDGDLDDDVFLSKEEMTPVQLPNYTMTMPELHPPSAFDLLTFKTDFLPLDNKLPFGNAMRSLINLLLTTKPRTLAQHITHIDLELTKVTCKENLGVGVFSGLEYLTLPQGHQMRKDLIARYEYAEYRCNCYTMSC